MPGKSGKEKPRSYTVEQLERIRVPNFCSVYANSTNSYSSFYDLRLIFGQVVVDPGREKPFVEDRVSVTLTWEHVGPLLDLLDKLLKAHELEHGPIRKQKQHTGKKKKD